MGKRSIKVRQMLMVLLAAACMLSAMPCAAMAAGAGETVSGNEIILGQDGEETASQTQAAGLESETEDEGDAETAEDTETDDPSDSEDASDEPDSPEETEGSEESEDTDTENPEEEPGDETDAEESEEDAEAEEIDPIDELEDEDSEESIMLLSAEDEIRTVAEQQTDSTCTDGNGVKYYYYGYDDGTANIYKLESYQNKVVDIPTDVGGYTVTQLTFAMTQSNTFPKVTIPETVTYIENYAFRFATINQLYYNAVEATTGSTNDTAGSFVRATIKELYIGQNVKVIPDYLFDNATITLDELTLDVEKIGQYAFYSGTTITNLTIGENVKEIGGFAFGFDDITNVYFNAINCPTAGTSGLPGPFRSGSISSITFGDKVTVIPAYILHGMSYSVDRLEIPDSVTEIGEYAFYGTGTKLGEVTIAENITSIGKEAFGSCSIDTLYYNAIEAEIPGMQVSLHHYNPFDSAKIGELHIGDKVRVLPDSLFFKVRLTQDELIIPDSVTYIGYEVLSYANDIYASGKISIGILEIGENVTYIGRAAFGAVSFDKAVIHAVETGSDLLPYYMEVPTCGSVEIHGNADSYDFFTKNTEADNIILLCEDFDTTYGEEHFNEDTSTFVTQVTDTCTVCGYAVEREEYVDGYTVIFEDYDGGELSKQYVKSGADATAPEEPERTGYEFTGWDKSYTSVTSDVTVRAQYKIQTFHVVFKDGEKTISDQEVDYGSNAKVPEDPTRPAEEWGSWKFTGWEGNYENVMKDEVVQAQFEKVMNEYEVIFYDADGKVLSRQTITHGEAAKTPDAPEKESTPQYSYTFKAWDGDTDNITGDVSFYPVYETKTRTYTVTFMNGNVVLERQTVEYGKAATAPSSPVKKADGEYTYRFAGWDKDYNCVTGDMTVYAMFERIKSTEAEAGEEDKENGDNDEDQGGDTENKDDTGEEKTGAGTDLILDIILPKLQNPRLVFDLKTGIKQKAGTEAGGIFLTRHEPEDDLISSEMEEPEDAGEALEDDMPPVDSGDAEETEMAEETAMEDGGETGEAPSGLKWLLLLITILIPAVLLILLFLFYLRRRKVCGTVLDAEGEPMYGMRITLAGKDMLETHTDEDGKFSFDGLKKGSYRLDIFNVGEETVFSMDISMKEKEEEDIFHAITSSHSSLETEVKGEKYAVDVAV